MSQSPAERDLAYARGNERLREHLTANEEIRVAARQHWWVLAKPFAIAVGLTLALIWSIVGVTLPLGSSLSEYLVAIALVGWAYFWWQWLSRRHDVFVVTDKRILKYQGLIIRDVPMMRISKITDMRYTRGALGEILGFGQIIIESAGQEQALRDLPYLSDPLENYRRLCEVIFGDKHHPRKSGESGWRGRVSKAVRRRAKRSHPSFDTSADWDDLDDLDDFHDLGEPAGFDDDGGMPSAHLPTRHPSGASTRTYTHEDPEFARHRPREELIYRSAEHPDDPARTRALPIITPEQLAEERRRQRRARGQRD